MSAPPLILASASPRRRELLASIGVVPVELISPAIDETPMRGEKPAALALRLARAKAESVPRREGFVLAADTVVAAGPRTLGKPSDARTASAFLAILSGRRHRVLTGVVLVAPGGRRTERLSESIVTFARLSDEQIAAYVASGEWRGKAGGYAIQGRAASFIRFLAGSYSNVVGLPLFETAQLLRGYGWKIPGANAS